MWIRKCLKRRLSQGRRSVPFMSSQVPEPLATFLWQAGRLLGPGAHSLGPAGALLEAVADLGGRLADGQVLLHVAAAPAALGHLHAQRKVLRQRVRRRPARLHERLGAHQEVGACARAWNGSHAAWPP